jgi:O-antigen ligase
MNDTLTASAAASPPLRSKLVAAAAGFWGLVVFLPVGMNYLALLLLLAVMMQGQLLARWERVRRHPVFWPLVFFVGWTLLVLSLQPDTYRETPANLWHGLRIALTLGLAVSLSRLEAAAAVKGLAVAFALVLALLAGYFAGLIPDADAWRHLTHPATNKTIAASILFSMLAASAGVVAVGHAGAKRVWALGVLFAALVVVMLVLEKRTAMLGFVLALMTVTVHQLRHQRWRLAGGLLVIGLFAGALYAGLPELRAKLDQGVAEVESALQGHVANESWNIRIQMIKHTTDMMLEKPVIGWGIGSWNEQWRQRVPDFLAGYNMPHNDVLWMGAQAGLPGALAWLGLMLSACWAAWCIPDWRGRIAFAVAVIATFSAVVNNGTRDATLGLPLLWLMGVALAYARPEAVDPALATGTGARGAR